MGIFSGLFGKKDNGSDNSSKSGSSYAPSVKGAPRQLYFLTDTGTAKVGHRLEDADRKVLYEAKVTKFSLIGATGMDFIDQAWISSTTRRARPHPIRWAMRSTRNTIPS